MSAPSPADRIPVIRHTGSIASLPPEADRPWLSEGSGTATIRLISSSLLATAWRNLGRELDRFIGDGLAPA